MSEYNKPLLESQSGCSPKSTIGINRNDSIFSNQISKQLKDSSYKSFQRTKVVGEYVLGCTLGQGCFGKVREALHTKTNKIYAVKTIKTKNLRRVHLQEDSVLKEINILKQLNHVNCLHLYNHFKDPETGNWYIVCDYIRGGSLIQLIQRSPSGALPLAQVRDIFTQLLNALEHIHSLKIYHKDIKPDNILMTHNKVVKLGDFNSAIDTKEENVLKKGFGCPSFQPPEIASGTVQIASAKTDIWQAGVTLYMMVVGKFPFDFNNNLLELMERICQCKYSIPPSIDAALADLIRKILTIRPEDRLSIVDIRNHPWMKAELPSEPYVPIQISPSVFKTPATKSCCTLI